jgi:hypothetical protein
LDTNLQKSNRMKTQLIIKKILPILCIILIGVLIKSCNEDLFLPEDIRNSVGPPVITGFEPKTGSIGTEVIITGDNLSSVVRDGGVTIGGGATEVLYRYSNNSLVIKLVGTERTGPIVITNHRGYVTSTETFTVIDFIPVINSLRIGNADLTEIVDAQRITVHGEVLNAVRRITFGTTNTVGRIVNRNDSMILVEVPYFEEPSATINFEYMAGGRVQVHSTNSFTVNNISIPPTITNMSSIPDVTGPNRVITLQGTHLDRVHRVFLSGHEDSTWTIISRSRTELRALVPAFSRGLTMGDLYIVHNIGRQEMRVKENLRIINEDALNFFVYRNVRLDVQRPPGEENIANFFDADNGETYTACDHGAVDIGEVTTFFFDHAGAAGGAAGQIRFNNPRNSAGPFPNFRCGTSLENDESTQPLTGVVGAKATRFRTLLATDPGDAELIRKVKEQAMDSMHLGMLVGAAVNSTINNLGSSSARWALTDGSPPGNDRWDIGDVVVFREYLNTVPPGTNAIGSGIGGRFGFIEIVSIEVDGNTVTESFTQADWARLSATQQRRTTVTINVYFQKVREL